jgi:hypothetical protein
VPLLDNVGRRDGLPVILAIPVVADFRRCDPVWTGWRPHRPGRATDRTRAILREDEAMVMDVVEVRRRHESGVSGVVHTRYGDVPFAPAEGWPHTLEVGAGSAAARRAAHAILLRWAVRRGLKVVALVDAAAGARGTLA